MTFDSGERGALPAPWRRVYLDRAVGFVPLSAAAVMGALAIASFSASGCNSRPLSGADGGAGVDGTAGRGGAAGDLAGAGAAGGFAGAPVAGGGGAGTAGGGGNAGASGWPATLRLVNAGTSDVVLPEQLAPTCGFSISAAAVGAASQPTSVTPPDSWCDCDRCAAAGRRLCDASNPLCNGPPTKLVAGAHLDFLWDGRVAVIAASPPSGSTCPVSCDHWEAVAAGTYVFTIDTLSGSFTAQATLPAASGVVLVTINN